MIIKLDSQQVLNDLINQNLIFKEVFQNQNISLEIFKPVIEDTQSSHEKDEIYIIISGTSEFILEKEKYTLKQGDFLFVPALKKHKFINFSKDFSTWVLFLL